MNEQSSFILYDASAGSGKTFTLVRNYLSDMLLSREKSPYRHILAITFTNKAVAEMKSRIIDSLKAFSQKPVPDNFRSLFEAVQTETGLDETTIQTKSYALLRSILHNYAAFDVSTIDSFTHRILRTFAKDLKISMSFEVQLEAEEILSEAVDRVIAKAGKDKKLTRALIDYSLSKVDDDRSWDIVKDLNDISKLLLPEDNIPYLEKLEDKTSDDFEEFNKILREEIKFLEETCRKTASDFFELIEANGLIHTDFYGGYVPKYFNKTLNGTLSYPSSANWKNEIETGNLYKKTTPADTKQILDSLQPQIAQMFRTSEAAIVRRDYLIRIRKENPSISLLAAITQEAAAIKEERNLLLIADFNRKISESLKDQPAAFIYERLGERYHNYYIDEFQDTSVLQWENLKPLIGDRLAQGGKLTLVGDAKQSIYRWRGGKAEQFMSLCADENPFFAEKKHYSLPDNFRSLPEIVNFNNGFFVNAAQSLSDESYRNLFENAAQNPRKKDEGYVEVRFVEGKTVAERAVAYLNNILEIISTIKEKGHAYKDICLLVRKNKEGILIADHLNINEIPIVTSESLLLANSPEVIFIVNILKYFYNPDDKNIRFELLDFLYKKLEIEETAFDFTYPKMNLTGNDLFSALPESEISFDLGKLGQLPLYDAVEYTIRSFALNKTGDAYLLFFLDFVYEYSVRHTGGIAGLLDMWEDKKEKLSITAPEGVDAVQIMTVHKAKGLEFPVVIYPFAEEKIDDMQRENVWVNIEDEKGNIPVTHLRVSKNMLDYSDYTADIYIDALNKKEMDTMNVFYVAMTRAERQLYVLTDLKEKINDPPKSFSELMVDFLIKQNKWDPEQVIFSFGSIPPPHTPEKEETPLTEVFRFTNGILSTAPENHSLTPVTKSGRFWGSPQEKAIETGNLLHDLMKEIYYTEDVEKVLDAAIRKGEILESEKTFYQNHINNIINHPDLNKYFSKDYQIFTEKEILANHTFLRPDRLCVSGQQVTIVDYKTGKPDKSHHDQINEYGMVLEEMGYSVHKKLLVYIRKQIDIVEIASVN